MYKNKKIVCVIPARGGSKGVPGKNIKEIAGKPLIAYSIEQAKRSKYIDRVIVSTDSKEIADICASFGAEIPFMRPARLATDKSSGIDVLLHAVDFIENTEGYKFDVLVLLHATAPLRTVEDIDKSIEELFKGKTDNVFSVTESYRNPYFNMVEVDSSKKVKLCKKGSFVTRQSSPQVYDMNASIYVWWKDILISKKKVFLDKSKIFIMPRERSIDVDDLIDFRLVEMLINERLASKECSDVL